MNTQVRLFLIINFILLLVGGLVALFSGAPAVWVGIYLTGVIILAVFAYRIFYLKNRRFKEALQKKLEEKKWDDLLAQPMPENELMEFIRPILREYSRSIYREHSVQMMDKQVQISTLQSQINPHFLYNTMESIRGQALVDGSHEIAHMAEALSSFFRYSIDQKGNVVTLQDELANIRNYMYIQEYRFQDKFTLKIQVDEEDSHIYDYLLPKLTIQPIVENAIYHGLETKSGKGLVTITVNVTPKRFLIAISDDGIGMSAGTLAEVNDRLRQTGEVTAQTNDQHGTGLALINVNRRIKLIFGDEYGIYVYSTPNKGTEVEIVLPLIKERKTLLEIMESRRDSSIL